MNIDPLRAFTDGLRTDVAQLRHHVLMELLIRWEETGESYLIDRVARAYDKVVSAWRHAARSYELRQQNLA